MILVTTYEAFLRAGPHTFSHPVTSSGHISEAVITRPGLRTRTVELGGQVTSSRSLGIKTWVVLTLEDSIPGSLLRDFLGPFTHFAQSL